MEIDGSDLDAMESATCAQLQVGEFSKITGLFPNLGPNALVPESI